MNIKLLDEIVSKGQFIRPILNYVVHQQKNPDFYKDGASFKEIYSLFEFDRKLRMIFLFKILKTEQMLCGNSKDNQNKLGKKVISAERIAQVLSEATCREFRKVLMEINEVKGRTAYKKIFTKDIMGFSFGGMIATMSLALDNKRIKKGILAFTGVDWYWINWLSPYVEPVCEGYKKYSNEFGYYDQLVASNQERRVQRKYRTKKLTE